jgi:hypothetical protein
MVEFVRKVDKTQSKKAKKEHGTDFETLDET